MKVVTAKLFSSKRMSTKMQKMSIIINKIKLQSHYCNAIRLSKQIRLHEKWIKVAFVYTLAHVVVNPNKIEECKQDTWDLHSAFLIESAVVLV